MALQISQQVASILTCIADIAKKGWPFLWCEHKIPYIQITRTAQNFGAGFELVTQKGALFHRHPRFPSVPTKEDKREKK